MAVAVPLHIVSPEAVITTVGSTHTSTSRGVPAQTRAPPPSVVYPVIVYVTCCGVVSL